MPASRLQKRLDDVRKRRQQKRAADSLDFTPSSTHVHWLGCIQGFIDAEILPAVDAIRAEAAAQDADRWQHSRGLWNLFLPHSAPHEWLAPLAARAVPPSS